MPAHGVTCGSAVVKKKGIGADDTAEKIQEIEMCKYRKEQ
jgi:hypothetical protein